ncbi:MAG: FliO/MopB family protein [Silvanigrellales bacterium]|jgi:flagellar biogenesis protein FliO|nr:FliO/MopB family protein [Silvanigrellales bacterium]
MTFPNIDANVRSNASFFARLAFHLGAGALGLLITLPFGVRCFAQSLVPASQVQTEAVPPLALPPVLANEPEGRLAVSAAEAVGGASPSTATVSEAQKPLGEDTAGPVLSEATELMPEAKSAAEAVEFKDSTTSPATEIPSPLPPENAGSIDFNPWQSLGLVGGMLVFLAAGGIFLVRFKNRGLFPVSKQEKLMEIVGTLAVAPKRSVVLVRIKGEEFAIASTEQGITFLKTIGAQGGELKSTVSVGEPSLLSVSRPEPRRFARESTPRLATPPNPSASSKEVPVEPGNAQDKEPSGSNPKSEILLSALRNMRGKNPKEAAAHESAPQNSKTSAFPRYLANAFAEESRRELKGQAAEEHQMESVTSLIREKLREMKPLA